MYKVSPFVRVLGETVFIIGALVVIETSYRAEMKETFNTELILAIIGGSMYIFGRVGESYSKRALKEAFGYLGDAIDYFNTAHAKGSSHFFHLEVSLAAKLENDKFIPAIGFVF